MKKIKSILKRYFERKKIKTVNQKWKDYNKRILEIEKKESLAFGFLLGFIFNSILFTLIIYFFDVL